jgi:galactokinase
MPRRALPRLLSKRIMEGRRRAVGTVANRLWGDHNHRAMSTADGASDAQRVRAAFARLAGHLPDGLWSSPGRVNLIGEHTDYNDGLVLPVAIDRSAVVAAGLRGDGMVRCASLQVGGVVETSVDGIAPGGVHGWAGPVLGALWGMHGAGLLVSGIDLVVDSAIPIGAGLASSAALAVAAVLAATDLTGQRMSLIDIARCCQAGEQAIAGAPTGLMDQVAVLTGRAGHAVFLDCRSMGHELVPFALESCDARLLVIDTTVAHDNSASGYRERREQCAQAAQALGVASLRDATLDAVMAMSSGALQRRARHVVTENARVLRVVELLRAGRVREIGALLDQSQASLRDDYEVSCAQLDCAAEAARQAGAWGARMTGAGFGGSAIALVPTARCDAVAAAVGDAFAERGYRAPRVESATTADGAARCG